MIIMFYTETEISVSFFSVMLVQLLNFSLNKKPGAPKRKDNPLTIL